MKALWEHNHWEIWQRYTVSMSVSNESRHNKFMEALYSFSLFFIIFTETKMHWHTAGWHFKKINGWNSMKSLFYSQISNSMGTLVEYFFFFINHVAEIRWKSLIFCERKSGNKDTNAWIRKEAPLSEWTPFAFIYGVFFSSVFKTKRKEMEQKNNNNNHFSFFSLHLIRVWFLTRFGF